MDEVSLVDIRDQRRATGAQIHDGDLLDAMRKKPGSAVLCGAARSSWTRKRTVVSSGSARARIFACAVLSLRYKKQVLSVDIKRMATDTE